MALSILFFIVVLTGLVLFVYPVWRRRRVLKTPFPPAWTQILDQRLPHLKLLSAAERRQLLDYIRLFLSHKRFHGCAGLQVNDEMRVVIAAQACLLLLNRRTEVYPLLHHVLLYPAMFTKETEELNEDGTVSEVQQALLGESWDEGKVVLSWEDVEHDLMHIQDGENVVLHEFAHQLDAENGGDNGMPILRHNDPVRWQTMMSQEFTRLSAAVERDEETFLDPYAASAPAEFFAVATETFFELPEELKQHHRPLYEELRCYYRINPAQWLH